MEKMAVFQWQAENKLEDQTIIKNTLFLKRNGVWSVIQFNHFISLTSYVNPITHLQKPFL